MSTTDAELVDLPDHALRERLACKDWKNVDEYMPDEQLFRLFRIATQSGNSSRSGILLESLNRRILARARGFIVKQGIFPSLAGDFNQVTRDLAQDVWDTILRRPSDAAHAERAFGQLFLRRAIDFQRKLFAKKRKLETFLAETEPEQDEQTGSDLDPSDNRDTNDDDDCVGAESPEISLEKKQNFAELDVKLKKILTPDEYDTFIFMTMRDMKTKDIAKVLGKTSRMVLYYMASAQEKISKEFTK